MSLRVLFIFLLILIGIPKAVLASYSYDGYEAVLVFIAGGVNLLAVPFAIAGLIAPRLFYPFSNSTRSKWLVFSVTYVFFLNMAIYIAGSTMTAPSGLDLTSQQVTLGFVIAAVILLLPTTIGRFRKLRSTGKWPTQPESVDMTPDSQNKPPPATDQQSKAGSSGGERLTGLVLFIVGIIVLWLGISAGSLWAILVGLVMMLVGLVTMILGPWASFFASW